MKPIGTCLFVGGVCAVLAACSSPQREMPDLKPQLRQNVQTAPADLQLLCASEAANRFGFSDDEILPVTSKAISPTLFSVKLKAKDQLYDCLIDSNARISELGQSAPSYSTGYSPRLSSY